MGLSSHPVRVENSPPETKLLPWKDHQLPLNTSDDQMTRPLHANLLLQHETEGIHTTKQESRAAARKPRDAASVLFC